MSVILRIVSRICLAEAELFTNVEEDVETTAVNSLRILEKSWLDDCTIFDKMDSIGNREAKQSRKEGCNANKRRQ
jgi:hypothetical protein